MEHNNGRVWPLNGIRRNGKAFSSPQESQTRERILAESNLIDAQVISETRTTASGGSVYMHGAVVPDAIPAEFYEVAADAPPVEEEEDDLGFDLEAAGPRKPIRDTRWAMSLRRFGRALIWCLPAAVIAAVVASIFGWPTPGHEPTGASPGTWLVVTLLSFGLWLLGVTAVAALFAPGPGRPWAVAAMLATMAGTVLLLPVIGVAGLARPAVSRTAGTLGAEAAGDLEARFLDGAVGRWLAFGGFVLLAVGVIALALALMAAEVMNRFDGWLMGGAVAVAAFGGFVSWDFLLTLAALMMLASTLGVAWTASRLTLEGQLRDV